MVAVRSSFRAMVAGAVLLVALGAAPPASAEINIDEDIRQLLEVENVDMVELLEVNNGLDVDVDELMDVTQAPTMAPTEMSTSGSGQSGPMSVAFATIAALAAVLSGAAAMV